MDTKDFLMTCAKECTGNTCDRCKFYEGRCALRLSSSGESYKELEQRIDRAISIAEKLAHVKTYADDFFEKFPNAQKKPNGLPKTCRDLVYGMKDVYCRTNCCSNCSDCWNEPYMSQNDRRRRK